MKALLAHFVMLTSQCLFGLYPLMLQGSSSLPLPLLLLVRESASCIALVPLALVVEGRTALSGCFYPRDRTTGKFSPRRFILLCSAGAVGIFGSQMLFGNSVRLAGPTTGAVIESLTPMCTAIVALVLGLERRNGTRKVGGALFAAAGAVTIINSQTSQDPAAGFGLTKAAMAATSAQAGAAASASAAAAATAAIRTHGGIVLGLLNNFGLTWYFFILQQLTKDHAPISLTVFQCAVSAVLMFTVAARSARTDGFDTCEKLQSQFEGLGGTLAAVVVICCYYNFAMIWSSNHLDSTVVAVYQSLNPMATAVASAVVLKVPMTSAELAGMGLIFVGFRLIIDLQKGKQGSKSTPTRGSGGGGGGGGGGGSSGSGHGKAAVRHLGEINDET